MNGWGWAGRLLAFATLVMSGDAMAQYRHRVLLLEHESEDDAGREITTRVRGELRAAASTSSIPIADPHQSSSIRGPDCPRVGALVER